MNGIARQAGRVVGVRVAAGNGEHTLRQQLMQGMIDLTRLPSVLQTGGEIIHQPQTTIGSLQQQSAAIRATISLTKLSHYRFAKNSWKQQTLCCVIVRHEEASNCASNSV